MEENQTPRDNRWDEKDTTDDRPLMPRVDGPITFPPGAAKHVRTDPDGDCVERIEETRVEINEVVPEQPAIRTEEGKIVIPVVKEKMVMVKKLVVTEEIHLRPVKENCDDEDEGQKTADKEALPQTSREINTEQKPPPASGDLGRGGPKTGQ